MYFQELQHKLIAVAKEKVRAGEVTERGLARSCVISQPHLHNVLKHARGFSCDSADRLMRALDLNISDLLWRVPGDVETEIQAIPIVRNRIGPGAQATFSATQGHLPLPSWLTKGLVDPVVARIGADLVMPRSLSAHDLVLLDQNPALRSLPDAGSTWVVAEGAGLRARYLQLSGTDLYLSNEITRYDPARWQSISVEERNILDVVRARIVWIGREMETGSAGSFNPAC